MEAEAEAARAYEVAAQCFHVNDLVANFRAIQAQWKPDNPSRSGLLPILQLARTGYWVDTPPPPNPHNTRLPLKIKKIYTSY